MNDIIACIDCRFYSPPNWKDPRENCNSNPIDTIETPLHGSRPMKANISWKNSDNDCSEFEKVTFWRRIFRYL